jgi:hypothetical protein
LPNGRSGGFVSELEEEGVRVAVLLRGVEVQAAAKHIRLFYKSEKEKSQQNYRTINRNEKMRTGIKRESRCGTSVRASH